MNQKQITQLAGLAALSLFACETNETVAPPSAATATVAAAPGMTVGKVIETMNSGGYTYVHVDNGTHKVWAAGPQTTVAVGDTVSLPPGAPMRNFESKTLGRTFDVVQFVSTIGVGVAATPTPTAPAAAAPSPHGGAAAVAPTAIDVSGLTKAEGGHTVAELFANKSDLAGQEIAVRGKVAKVTTGVMGKNWVHVQDGTGSAGTNDLTVTTANVAAVGDTVLVRGKLSTAKDFGAGYKYDVIVEDASVAVE